MKNEKETEIKFSEITLKDEWYWYIFNCPFCNYLQMLLDTYNNDKPPGYQYCQRCGVKINYIKDTELI